MKKVAKILLSIFIIIFCISRNSFACTSFAVYSDNSYYGKNFDHYIKEIKFTITPEGNRNVFEMKLFYHENYYPSVGMSDKGLFMSLNDLYPKQAITQPKENQVDVCNLAFSSLYHYDNVQEIKDDMVNKQLVCSYISAHVMFADS